MDSYKTPLGELKIGVFGHASLLLQWNGKNIYVDPYSEVTDYTGKDKADLILVTHSHYDHYDKEAFSKIETPDTLFIVSKDVGKVAPNYVVLNNNESCNYEGMIINAVASYNVNRRNEEGKLFHPKGEGNGYILDLSGFRLYIFGDTEPIAEMKYINNIDIAFIPKNLPYTMTDDEFVQAANMIKPRVLYPVHYFEIDPDKLHKQLDLGITLTLGTEANG